MYSITYHYAYSKTNASVLDSAVSKTILIDLTNTFNISKYYSLL